MDDLKQRIFWWFFRPFIRRRREDIPQGVSDEELIRRGDAVGRRPFNLLLGCLLFALLAWGLVEVHGWLSLGAARRPDDIYISKSTVWPGAIFMAMGLSLFLALVRMRLFGASEEDRAINQGFEARHKVSALGAYVLLGVLALAMGAVFVAAADDHVAFDGQTLRWQRFYTEHTRPLADIAEVRWYRRAEMPRGGPREWKAACVVFKDGTRFLSTDGFFSVSLPQEACAKLAKAAGAPAHLDLDVIPLEERGTKKD